MRKMIETEEAKGIVEAVAARRIAVRRELSEKAIADVSQDSVAIDAIVRGKRPWWPALAPLTKGEREAVYRVIVAVATNGEANVNPD